MTNIFEIVDRANRKIRLTDKQWKHIQKHSHMHNFLENIKNTIKSPATIRYNKEDESVRYFYKEYKEMPYEEKYLIENFA